MQSIKRREQGTFNVLIVLNSNGELLELKFENKRPKRLYEKTKQILKSYKFPKPPSVQFIDKEKVKHKNSCKLHTKMTLCCNLQQNGYFLVPKSIYSFNNEYFLIL